MAIKNCKNTYLQSQGRYNIIIDKNVTQKLWFVSINHVSIIIFYNIYL